MRIFRVVFFCLLSLPAWSADSQQVLSQLAEMDSALGVAAQKEGELVAEELDRKRQQPAYQLQYINPGVVRDYHREADRALANIIALKKQTLATTLMAGPACAQAIAKYRAETFDKLQVLYRQFVSREPPFPLVAPVYNANARDSLGFLTRVVMTCSM
ncbi:hypothetical protein [Zhongshania aquimaris]|uniref:Uncharacterized protein n=1 Tax=Zhongshania aquimaris TaxID=2857107 RepID=A0ABS6VM81_9GAMM|nr:hypothetical protein [Zhongshania aquimaris]MBW2939423.1 hypothetical protein [Zhongshania aquimaris]